MEAERLEAVKADETGSSQRRRSCLLEGSDDSAESRGVQQSLYAGARNERNADSLCVTRELTAATNRESGHNNFLWRVCDWSDSGRNSLAFLRALGRGVWNGASAEWNTRLERIERAV